MILGDHMKILKAPTLIQKMQILRGKAQTMNVKRSRTNNFMILKIQFMNKFQKQIILYCLVLAKPKSDIRILIKTFNSFSLIMISTVELV